MPNPDSEHFVNIFKERLNEAIELEIFTDYKGLYAVPFTCTPYDLNDEFWGGIWLPNEDTQKTVEHLSHWRITDDFEEAVLDYELQKEKETGEEVNLSIRGPFLRGVVTVINEQVSLICHDFTSIMGIREQVELDYGLIVRNSWSEV